MLVFGIYAKQIKGQRVQLAPFGMEGCPRPCLVWTDPNPDAMVRRCTVLAASGTEITAKSARGLIGAARRAGLVAHALDWYMP